MQCIFPDLADLQGARSCGNRRAYSNEFAGGHLYCGRYAAAARCAGNHRDDVQDGVFPGVYQGEPDGVHVRYTWIEFLYGADCQRYCGGMVSF